MFLSKMKIPFLTGLIVLLFALSSQVSAQDTLSLRYLFPRRHQAGVRIGGWANLGETPSRLSGDEQTQLRTDFKGGSFYIEGYYAHRFSRRLMGEITLGIVNRGGVTVSQQSNTFVGSLLIYPMTVRAKFYPFAEGLGNVFPYLTAGGGIYYAKHNVQFYQSADVIDVLNTDSETKISYVLGGGIDIPLASIIALEFSGQYLPVKFSSPIIEIKDYSALTFTVGVKYLFANIKKHDDRPRRGR